MNGDVPGRHPTLLPDHPGGSLLPRSRPDELSAPAAIEQRAIRVPLLVGRVVGSDFLPPPTADFEDHHQPRFPIGADVAPIDDQRLFSRLPVDLSRDPDPDFIRIKQRFREQWREGCAIPLSYLPCA
ncbi:hypothetical protein SDC9_19876 [bioreactor metagenome]|uniref:Uncharacterized protein n=1 Tax=bioreactor metagenome TaxID=1076179 RepID=A0A644U574_9ZZZZ